MDEAALGFPWAKGIIVVAEWNCCYGADAGRVPKPNFADRVQVP